MKIEAIRLTPLMVSRKNQVLAFIRDYYASHQVGPSITEIANAVNCARSRVQEAIRKLEREQLIHRVPNKPRGITPISSHQDAIRQLEALGYTVNPTRMELVTPPPPVIDLDEDGRLIVRGTKAGLC